MSKNAGRVLNVWCSGDLIGQLNETQDEGLSFVYSDGWLQREESLALSFFLPKRAEPYLHEECHPFFNGLLPEGARRDEIAQSLGISREDDFSFLERLGGDVAGAIQFRHSGERPAQPHEFRRAKPLDETGLIQALDTLPIRPLLQGKGNFGLLLAGTQAKVPVILRDGEIALPQPGQPTTHIIKLPSFPFPGMTENEAFVMRLAVAVGLDAVPVEPYVVQGRTFLLVERYDRAASANGDVGRLHQESFCQALGLIPRRERDNSSRSSLAFKDCFALLRRVATQPTDEVLKLLDSVIFNLITGNYGVHGKHYSLCHDRTGWCLAPLYGLLALVAYPELSSQPEQGVDEHVTLAGMEERGWAKFAIRTEMSYSLVQHRVAEISGNVERRAHEIADGLKRPGFDAGALSLFAGLLVDRAGRCKLTV